MRHRRNRLSPIRPGAGWRSADPKPSLKFDYDDVVRRAKDLAAAPYAAEPPPLPEALSKLDFDAWRDIRFRPEKAFLNDAGQHVPAAIVSSRAISIAGR